ncbi:MAG: cation:proton antiporter, partial [Ktedonobacterales bacterium]
MADLTLWFALIAIVLTAAALVAGIVMRAPLSFPMLFFGLGIALGQGVLGIVNISPHTPALTAVATLSLALVLFLDAVNLQVDELRRDWRIPVLSLGPGTLLTLAGVALAAHFLLGTSTVNSLLLGAVLASTDPIVLRDVVRNERIPRSIRRALSVEAGMNDVVVLPIVLVLIAIGQGASHGPLGWLGFLAQLLVVSPLVGLAVGGVGAWLMGRADARFSVPREYQALYGLGLVLAAYSAAQAAGGDGFLAAFFAGLAVAIFDVSLCDCFLEYGEVTAEMAMLLAFLLFGAALGPLFGAASLVSALALAIVTIGVVRPVVMGLLLRRAKMSFAARAFIGWFGPRGLSALLLALLVVEANAPDAIRLLTVTGVVVAFSVVAHGISATPLSNWYVSSLANPRETAPEEREGTAA